MANSKTNSKNYIKNLVLEATYFGVRDKNFPLPTKLYGRNDFTFNLKRFSSLRQMSMYLNSQFLLNRPLKQSVIADRKISQLELFSREKYNYVILDIEIDNLKDYQNTLNYFEKYYCCLMKANSFNEKDNFNIKGILVTYEYDEEELKLVLAKVQDDLKVKVIFQNSVYQHGFTACLKNVNPILLNDIDKEFKVFKIDDRKKSSYSKRIKIGDLGDFVYESDTIRDMCLETFKRLGFVFTGKNAGELKIYEKDNDNYFFYDNNPYFMHNINPCLSVNIYDYITTRMAYNKKIEDFFKGELKENPQLETYLINKKNIKISDVYNLDSDKLENLCDCKESSEVKDDSQSSEDISDTDISENIETSEKDKKKEKSQPIFNVLNANKQALIIHSPMGTGKSTIIKEILKKATKQNKQALIITNRVSLADEFYTKYKDSNIKLYKDFKSKKISSKSHLIIQYDSLHKIKPREFDFVILDEFTSLMLYARSPTNQNATNFSKLAVLLEKNVIISDAFLTNFTVEFLNSKKKVIYFCNLYKDNTNIFKVPDKETFFYYIDKNIIEDLRNGYKTSISCNRLDIIGSLKMMLEEKGLKVSILTSLTLDAERKQIYESFNNEFNNLWDVLIFSPTLTVGVSIMAKIKNHYHFDDNTSIDPISSLQMIKRTRVSENIFYYVNKRHSKLCLNLNIIRNKILEKANSNNIMSSLDSTLLEMDKDGEPKLSLSGILASKIELLNNFLNYNRSLTFERLLEMNFYNVKTDVNSEIFELERYKTNKENPLMDNSEEILIKTLKEMDCDFEKLNENSKNILNNVFKNTEVDWKNITEKKFQLSKIIKKCMNENLGILKKGYLFKIFHFNFSYETLQDLLFMNKDNIEVMGFIEDIQRFNLKFKDEKIQKYSINSETQKILKKCGYIEKDEYLELDETVKDTFELFNIKKKFEFRNEYNSDFRKEMVNSF